MAEKKYYIECIGDDNGYPVDSFKKEYSLVEAKNIVVSLNMASVFSWRYVPTDGIKEKINSQTTIEKLLETGTVVHLVNGKTYGFLPFWFEKDGDDLIIHRLGNLPKELRGTCFKKE